MQNTYYLHSISMNMLNKNNLFSVLLLFLASSIFMHGQMFKTATGSLDDISGVLRYNVIFEYAEELVVPKHASENAFLERYSKKINKKENGAGDKFKKQWFSYRTELFQPKFIQEFNLFNLKEKQVTVAPNISDAEYVMVVRTTSIDPGGSNFFFKSDAWLKVYVRIYRKGHPENVLYATEAIDVHSEGANSDIFNRIMSAYSELGSGLAKHLSRKT